MPRKNRRPRHGRRQPQTYATPSVVHNPESAAQRLVERGLASPAILTGGHWSKPKREGDE
jgi:hypothetical protein